MKTHDLLTSKPAETPQNRRLQAIIEAEDHT
jgi:hypothetical protein